MPKRPARRATDPTLAADGAGDAAERVVTAHHEAGHAVAAVLLRLPLRRVDIEARSDRLGFTDGGPGLLGWQTPGEVLDWHAVAWCAGPAAEGRLAGVCTVDMLDGCLSDDSASDSAKIAALGVRCSLALKYAGDADRWRSDRAWDAERLVAGAWPAIVAVAERLLAEGALPSWRVRQLVREGWRGRCPRVRLTRRRYQQSLRKGTARPLRFPRGWPRA